MYEPSAPPPCPTTLIAIVAIPARASEDATAHGAPFLESVKPWPKIATGQPAAGVGPGRHEQRELDGARALRRGLPGPRPDRRNDLRGGLVVRRCVRPEGDRAHRAGEERQDGGRQEGRGERGRSGLPGPLDRRDRRQGEDRPLSAGTERKVGRRRLALPDLPPDLLRDRVDALRREQACAGYLPRVCAGEDRRTEREQQLRPIRLVRCRPACEQVAPEGRAVEPLPVGAADAACDDQQIPRVSLELLIALDVQRVRGRLPDDLVDPDSPAARADEEHGLARHGRDIDRPRERDRDPRLDVEAVERVEHVDVGAVGRPHRAIGLRKVHAEAGHLRVVRGREEVARERLAGLDGGERGSRNDE